MWQLRLSALERRRPDDRRHHHLQPQRRRLPGNAARGPGGAARDRPGERRAGAQARATLRSAGSGGARPARVPLPAAHATSGWRSRWRRGSCSTISTCSRSIATPRSPSSLGVSRRDRGPGGQGDFAARTQAGPRLRRPGAGLHRAGRVHPQDGRRLRGLAQRGRGAAAAAGRLLPARAERQRGRRRDQGISAGAAALGAMAGQVDLPAPADDLQGRQLDREVPARAFSTTASAICGRWC